jgi:hypothetical protein
MVCFSWAWSGYGKMIKTYAHDRSKRAATSAWGVTQIWFIFQMFGVFRSPIHAPPPGPPPPRAARRAPPPPPHLPHHPPPSPTPTPISRISNCQNPRTSRTCASQTAGGKTVSDISIWSRRRAVANVRFVFPVRRVETHRRVRYGGGGQLRNGTVNPHYKTHVQTLPKTWLRKVFSSQKTVAKFCSRLGRTHTKHYKTSEICVIAKFERHDAKFENHDFCKI